MKRYRNSTAKLVSIFLLILGLTALVFSIFYTSSILAFIGLGLTFWGGIFLYIAPEKYVKQELLDSTVLPTLTALNQILTELNYQGKAVYLPPKYFKDFEKTKVYIPKSQKTNLPTPEEIQQEENKTFLRNLDAVLITPPGFNLLKLFEETMGTSFTKVDLKYLQQNLPKLLIEDLEIAENVEIEVRENEIAKEADGRTSVIQARNDIIHVKLTEPVYDETCTKTSKLQYIRSQIGCPIWSAIACALAKATGKPVTVEEIQAPADGKTIEAYYRILETREPEEQTGKAVRVNIEAASRYPTQLLTATNLILTTFGSAILAWVSWLTWYDITTWGKDLALIFFSSRADEAIGLGIGMRVIYYFLIGLALLFSGVITLLLRRRSKL